MVIKTNPEQFDREISTVFEYNLSHGYARVITTKTFHVVCVTPSGVPSRKIDELERLSFWLIFSPGNSVTRRRDRSNRKCVILRRRESCRIKKNPGQREVLTSFKYGALAAAIITTRGIRLINSTNFTVQGKRH